MRISLIVVVVMATTVVIGFYLANKKRKTLLLANRTPKNIADIGKSEFSSMSPETFQVIWKDIANCLGVAPDIMRPDDVLSMYIPRHLAELQVDHVERFLEERGVQTGEVALQSTIRELVNVIVEKGKKAVVGDNGRQERRVDA